MKLDKKRWHCRILGHHWLFHPQFDIAFYGFKPYYCWYCGEYRDRNKKRIPQTTRPTGRRHPNVGDRTDAMLHSETWPPVKHANNSNTT